MPAPTVAESRSMIIMTMISQGLVLQKRLRKGDLIPQWNPLAKPCTKLDQYTWGVCGMQAARQMEEAAEIEIIDGSWMDGEVRVIAGPKFPYPAPDRTARQVARLPAPISDILTEDFLRECEEVAAEMEALNKRRDALWAQIADKVRDLPDLDTAQQVFNEISYACATKDGQFRQTLFNVERAFVYDHFKYGEGTHRVRYVQIKHEPTDTAEGCLPAGPEKV